MVLHVSGCVQIEEFVLLRCAISLKVNYEKVKFSKCVFCYNLSEYILSSTANATLFFDLIF